MKTFFTSLPLYLFTSLPLYLFTSLPLYLFTFIVLSSVNIQAQGPCISGLTLTVPSDGTHLEFNSSTGLWDFKINTSSGDVGFIDIGGLNFKYYLDNILFDHATVDNTDITFSQQTNHLSFIQVTPNTNGITMNKNGEFITGSVHVYPDNTLSISQRDEYGVYFDGELEYAFNLGLIKCDFLADYEDSNPYTTDYAEIEGKLKTFSPFTCGDVGVNNHGLPDADVLVSYDNTAYSYSETLVSSPLGGKYNQKYPIGPDYKITPIHLDNKDCGLDQDDLDIIRKMVLGIQTEWDYPWLFYAADVNSSNSVTTWDLALIQRQILDIEDLSDESGWKFLNTTQYISEVNNIGALTSTASIDNFRTVEALSSSNSIDNNFYVVKGGDVDLTCTDCSELRLQKKNHLQEQHMEVLAYHEDNMNVYEIIIDADGNFEHMGLNLDFNEQIKNIEFIGLNDNNLETHNITHDNLKLSIINMDTNSSVAPSIKVITEYNSNFSVHTADNNHANSYIYTTEKKLKLEPILKTLESNRYLIYPNPTDGILNIQSNENIDRVDLFTIEGKQLSTKYNEDNDVVLDMTSYNSGVYLLRIHFSDGEIMIDKVIRQ